MAINNVKAVGDDQRWKSEVEQEIAKLAQEVAFLRKQLRNTQIKRK